MIIRGYVEDDTYVSAISINKYPRLVELAEPKVAFEREVELADGVNTIDLVAVDLMGKPTRQQLTVHLDREGPLVSLIDTEVVGDQVQIEGSIFDNSRITRLIVAGQTVPTSPDQSWEFREAVPLTSNLSAVPFEAEDVAGNITQGQIDVSSATGVKTAQTIPPHDPLQRWAAVDTANVMSDAGPQLSARLRMAKAGGPSIELRGLLSKEATAKAKAPLTLSDNTVYLEGKISSDSTITSFTINGKGCWQRKSKQIFFGHKIVLEPGDNLFTIEAVDEQGNAQKAEVVVTHAVQQVKQLDSRLRLVLLPFELKGTSSELSEAVHGNFLQAMVSQERFGLVSQAKLEELLETTELKERRPRQALVPPQNRQWSRGGGGGHRHGHGKRAGSPGSRPLLWMWRGTEVIASIDIYGEGLSLPQLQTLIEGLAWKFKQRFPISEGFVLKAEGKKIFVDLGTPHGMKKNMKLVIFRDGEEIKHPIPGKVLHTETEIVAEAKVDSVFDDVSRAVLLKSENPVEIKQLDRVITK